MDKKDKNIENRLIKALEEGRIDLQGDTVIIRDEDSLEAIFEEVETLDINKIKSPFGTIAFDDSPIEETIYGKIPAGHKFQKQLDAINEKDFVKKEQLLKRFIKRFPKSFITSY